MIYIYAIVDRDAKKVAGLACAENDLTLIRQFKNAAESEEGKGLTFVQNPGSFYAEKVFGYDDKMVDCVDGSLRLSEVDLAGTYDPIEFSSFLGGEKSE